VKKFTFALHFEGMKLLFLFAVATFSSATYAASIEGMSGRLADIETIDLGDLPSRPGDYRELYSLKSKIQKRLRERRGEKKEEGFGGLPHELEEEKELPEGEKELPEGEKELPEGEKELPEGEKELPEGEKELPEGEEELLESKIEQLVKEKEQLEGEKEKLQEEKDGLHSLLEILDIDILNLSKALGRINIALGNLREQQIRRANMQEKRTI